MKYPCSLRCPLCASYEMVHRGKYGAWNTVKTKTITFTCPSSCCSARLVLNKDVARAHRLIE